MSVLPMISSAISIDGSKGKAKIEQKPDLPKKPQEINGVKIPMTCLMAKKLHRGKSAKRTAEE